jgi:hypothetical protein
MGRPSKGAKPIEEVKKKELLARMTRCPWPGCTERPMQMVQLPYLELGDDNKIRKNDGIKVNCPTCQYHLFIFGTGQFGAMKDPLVPGAYTLNGPFERVTLIEAVMGAREITRKPQPSTLAEIKELKEKRAELHDHTSDEGKPSVSELSESGTEEHEP